MRGYPVTSRNSVIDCPVHNVTVALDEHGRIASSCPACKREAHRARNRWAQRRRRALRLA